MVEGFDIREEALEQIRSLGAKSIDLPAAEEGDTEDPVLRTQRLLTPHLAEADVVGPPTGLGLMLAAPTMRTGR